MKSIKAFCNFLYSSSYLPIHYYQNQKLILKLPDTASFDLTDAFRIPLLQKETKVCYITSKAYTYYGLIQNPAKHIQIFVGPVTSTPVTRRMLPAILSEASVSLQYSEDVWDFFCSTPTYSYLQFVSFLSLIHQKVNNEILDFYQHFMSSDFEGSNAVPQKHSVAVYQAKENEVFHNTYHFEQELYGYIEAGNVTALQKLFATPRLMKEGILADNSLRQAKNIFLSSITQVSRHSILGGLDTETAYSLADVYIQEAEILQDITAIQKLQYTATLDYANRVANSKIPSGMPQDIYDCIQFISNHTNCQIQLKDIADYVGKNPSYLSLKFKNYLGFNINQFIMRTKLEEAKSLLTFTDKSLSEISNYLCFSSQSYFQNVFKSKYGITPNQYRSQNKVSERYNFNR